MKTSKIAGIVVIIIINLVILLLIEVSLRMLNVGDDTSLILEKQVGEEDYLILNSRYIAQFYTQGKASIPSPSIELFPKQKPENSFRIYIIGESTSRGFPYSKVEAFPAQIKQMLNRAGIDEKVEVINFSIDATCSNTGVDIAKHIIKYPPDLAIIYYGHNEFIGIGGSGEQNSLLFKANKLFSGLRMYQLIKKWVSKPQSEEMLLEKMAKKERIEFKDERYSNTIKDFEKNYDKILSILKSEGTDLITCGVVRNLKDLKPANTKKLGVAENNKLQSLLDTTPNSKAITLIDSLSKIHSNIYFQAGKNAINSGNTELARYCFTKACDYDNLRLRASSDINRIIQKLSIQNNCSYINFQDIFNSKTKAGIAGNELLLEHVHPSLKGHKIMADTLTDLILKKYFTTPKNPNYKMSGIHNSIVDEIAVSRVLHNLFNKYPLSELDYFNPTGFSDIFKSNKNALSTLEFKNDSLKSISDTLSRFFQRNEKIGMVHFNYATILYNKKKLNESYYEFSIAYDINPLNVRALSNMALIRYLTGERRVSLEMQDWVCKIDPNYVKGLSHYWIMLKNEKQDIKARDIEKKLKKLGANVNSGNTLSAN